MAELPMSAGADQLKVAKGPFTARATLRARPGTPEGGLARAGVAARPTSAVAVASSVTAFFFMNSIALL